RPEQRHDPVDAVLHQRHEARERHPVAAEHALDERRWLRVVASAHAAAPPSSACHDDSRARTPSPAASVVAAMRAPSARDTGRPPSAAIELTAPAESPHGRIHEKGVQSTVRLTARPWHATPPRIRMPMDATFDSPTHTPGCPLRRVPATPHAVTTARAASSRRPTYGRIASRLSATIG